MFIITILFSGLFWQEISGSGNGSVIDCGGAVCCVWCWESVDPEPEWAQKYQNNFDQLGVVNFSASAAHLLHGLTVEAAMMYFNIKLPIQNGIPTSNPDLSADDSEALLSNIPSRPNGYSSPGMYGFVDSMDHISDPNWMSHAFTSKLDRLAHVFHMQELWAVARKAADDFDKVSEDICKGALDHANNGVDKSQIQIFMTYKNSRADPITLTWDDNGESLNEWETALQYHYASSGRRKSMGLYTQCLLRKFPQTEQPLEIDSCCTSKTVGEYSYTKVSTGKVPTQCLNNCIYSRDDKPGSQYCFTSGEQEVHCLN